MIAYNLKQTNNFFQESENNESVLLHFDEDSSSGTNSIWTTLSDKKPYYLVPSPNLSQHNSSSSESIKAVANIDKKETYLWNICTLNEVNCQVGDVHCQ